MKLFGLPVPFTKQTDQNTVTPIRPLYMIETPQGTVTEAFAGMWSRQLQMEGASSLLAFSSVYACVQLIARDISKLPLRLQRLTSEEPEVWQNEDNPSYSPLLRAPNRYQTPNQFLEYWVASKLIHGNAYALKQRNGAGKVEALYLLDPQKVMAMVAPDGQVFYKANTDTLAGLATPVMVPGDEMIHDRMNCFFHPLCGVSPLYAAAMSASQGRRIQTNSSKFFENMSRPSLHLSFVGQIDAAKAEQWKAEFEQKFSGANLGKLLITGGDAKLNQLTIPAEQAQLVEQLGWTGEDAARAFGVPFYKLGLGDIPADIVGVNQEYYDRILHPHIRDIEALFWSGLALATDLQVNFDTRELLRLDDKRRAEKHELLSRAGVKKPNEARAEEGLPPVKGGDTPYLQQQNFSLGALSKRDESDDPFGTKKPETTPPAAPRVEDGDQPSEEERMALAITTELLKQGPSWLRPAA